jgi:hypothetical protein
MSNYRPGIVRLRVESLLRMRMDLSRNHKSLRTQLRAQHVHSLDGYLETVGTSELKRPIAFDNVRNLPTGTPQPQSNALAVLLSGSSQKG